MASHTSSKEARNRAVSKYVKENYDTVLLRFTKESNDKQLIAEHAKNYIVFTYKFLGIQITFLIYYFKIFFISI